MWGFGKKKEPAPEAPSDIDASIFSKSGMDKSIFSSRYADSDDEKDRFFDDPKRLSASASRLQSLFGEAPPDMGMDALSRPRVSAPSSKPPAESKPAAADPPPAADAPAATVTLFATLVQSFRSVGGAWKPAGQAGLALVGGPLPKPFQLVLYEPSSKRPFSITTVAPSLALATSGSQYVTLRDDQTEEWSIYFSTEAEARHLLIHATLVRAAAAAAASDPGVRSPWIAQDVAIAADGHAAQPGDTLGVRRTCWRVEMPLRPAAGGPAASPLGEVPAESEGDEAKPQRVTLGAAPPYALAWEPAVLGMRKGGVRYVVELPAADADGGAAGGGGLTFHSVEVLRTRRGNKEAAEGAAAPESGAPAPPAPAPPPEGGEARSDGASVDERSRGPSVDPCNDSEAADEAGQRASLISRMAKLSGAGGGGAMAGACRIPAGEPSSPSTTAAVAGAATPAAAMEAVALPLAAAAAPTPAPPAPVPAPAQLLAAAAAAPPVDLSPLLSLARESRSIHLEVKESVDSVGRRLGSITAAMEGIESSMLKTRSRSPELAPPLYPPSAGGAAGGGALDSRARQLCGELSEVLSEASRAVTERQELAEEARRARQGQDEAQAAARRAEEAMRTVEAELRDERERAAAAAAAATDDGKARAAFEAQLEDAKREAAEASAWGAALQKERDEAIERLEGAAGREAGGAAEALAEAEARAARLADELAAERAATTEKVKGLMGDVWEEIQEKLAEIASSSEGAGELLPRAAALGTVKRVIKHATLRLVNEGASSTG